MAEKYEWICLESVLNPNRVKWSSLLFGLKPFQKSCTHGICRFSKTGFIQQIVANLYVRGSLANRSKGQRIAPIVTVFFLCFKILGLAAEQTLLENFFADLPQPCIRFLGPKNAWCAQDVGLIQTFQHWEYMSGSPKMDPELNLWIRPKNWFLTLGSNG